MRVSRPYRLLGKMRTLRAADIQCHKIGRDVRDTDRRAHPAHDAVHEHLGDALEVAEDGFPHPFAHVDFLRTGLRAGVAIPAKRRFGIEIEEILLGIFERLNVVESPCGRETAASS